MKKIAFSIALLYAAFGMYNVIATLGCGGFVCDIGAYVLALPWSKLWDFGGPLDTMFEGIKAQQNGTGILNGFGVVINSVIIYFIALGIVKLIRLAMRKLNLR